MVLSHLEVENRVKVGEIKIFYSFLKSEDGSIIYYEQEQQVDLSQPDLISTRFFRKSISSYRMHLTVGPIAKTHSSMPVPGRNVYKQHSQCTDLRENNNMLILEPFETVSIATNERIVLGGNTVSIVTPRVTNTDSGLILPTAYIDPFFDGIMRVVIINITNRRQSLSLLEPIAQCIFFDIKGEISPTFKERFAHKSVFYGQNWKRIIDEEGDPFPRRKIPISEQTTFVKIWAKFLSLRSDIFKGFATLGTAIAFVTLFIGIGRFQATIENVGELENKLRASETEIENLNNRLITEIPTFGRSEIVITSGATNGTIDVLLNGASGDILSVYTQIDTNFIGPQIQISYRIFQGNTANTTRIEFQASINTPGVNEIRIPLIWIVDR